MSPLTSSLATHNCFPNLITTSCLPALRCVNVSFQELQALLGEAVGGLHTMQDEHFGISVVEYMAAGAVPIAHKSGVDAGGGNV